jgi:hypothetical protein
VLGKTRRRLGQADEWEKEQQAENYSRRKNGEAECEFADPDCVRHGVMPPDMLLVMGRMGFSLFPHKGRLRSSGVRRASLAAP